MAICDAQTLTALLIIASFKAVALACSKRVRFEAGTNDEGVK